MIKTIFLVRHGKAIGRDTKVPDFQRTLVKKGENESLGIAKKLKKIGASPELLLSSSADRALETAHIFAQRLGYPKKKILVKDSLYNEIKEEALLEIVKNVDNKYNSIMLFGHDPLFSSFAAYLLKNFNEGIPKSGVVCIEFRRKTWKGITKGNGRLKFYDYPKQISKAYKKTKMDIVAELSKNIERVLTKADARSAKKIDNSIKMTSEKLAKDFVKAMKSYKIKEKELKDIKKVKPKASDSAPVPKPAAKEDPSKTSKPQKTPPSKTAKPQKKAIEKK